MIEVQHSNGSYKVNFDTVENIIDRAQDRNSYTITDSNVAQLWLEGRIPSERLIVVPAGESSKSLNVFGQVHSELARRNAKRDSIIFAIGGGVIGDLGGFVAATYMRGIDLVQIPTTLLAMVDSSVGGKVGIDLGEGKNLVGAFKAPKEVIVDSKFLQTLPSRHLKNGLAEVLKYGFIHSPEILKLSEEELSRTESIADCIRIKAEIVQSDEFETTGRRATLNFGHTIGHAIETCLNYEGLLHGEAIAIGMIREAQLGEEIGISVKGTSRAVQQALELVGLPISHPILSESDQLLSVMRRDKKRVGKGISFSLLECIGTCKLVHDVSEEAVRMVLSSG